jgi:alkylhydroperoxidase family enzyme
MGVGGRAEETADEGDRRRPAAIAAAARGKRRGRHGFGQQVTLWSAGFEREQVHELKAAAAMARWSSGWRAEGEKGA